MPPKKLFQSTDFIYDVLIKTTENNSYDIDNSILRKSLENLLLSTKGEDVQLLLVEISMALKRLEMLANLKNFLRNSDQHVRLFSFRVVDQFGEMGNANEILLSKLNGEKGIILRINTEFQEIKINVGHAGYGINDDSELYWRRRISQLKHSIIKDIKKYVESVCYIFEINDNMLNSITSSILNYVLHVKEKAELQQDILISARTNKRALSNVDLDEVDLNLLEEFLNEAFKGGDKDDFAMRLSAIINKQPHLLVFEEIYSNLQHDLVEQTNRVDQITNSLSIEISNLMDRFENEIERSINGLAYFQLPDSLDFENFFLPFIDITKSTLLELNKHINNWVWSLNDNIRNID